jgi:ABC-type amino acid transport substrate-binding protein
MFASVIIISSFTAAVATALTIGELGGKVEDEDDLGRVKVVTVEGITSAAYLRSEGRNYRAADDLGDALRQLADGGADAVVYDEPVLRYRILQELDETLAVLPGTFARQDYGVAMPSGSGLREPLNRELLEYLRGSEGRPRCPGTSATAEPVSEAACAVMS